MPAVLFLSVFFLYLVTAVPVIYFEDNPMFITTAYTLGLAHPPGYPLINMLGNLAGIFPFANFAFRCNALSGAFAAAAVTFFYLCALQLTGRRVNAALFSLLFALSGNLWTQAVIFEVYTLFFACFFFLLWISLSGRLNDFRWIMLSAFIFGLGVTNHVALSVTLPGFLLFWYSSGESLNYRLSAKKLGLILASGVFSWAIQFYALLRSESDTVNTLFSWGRVNGLSEFISYVTGYKTYRDFSFNSAPVNTRINLFSEYLSSAMPLFCWLILIPIFLFGLYRFFLNDRLKLISFLLLSSGLLFYSMLQIAAMDIMLVVPWGTGLLVTLYGVDAIPLKAGKIFSICFALFIICFAGYQFNRYDYHNDYTAYNYFSDISDTLPENGSLELTQGIQMNYTLIYGLLGPGGGLQQGRGDKKNFTPYPLSGGKRTYTRGLLNSQNGRESEGMAQVWEHIRSYPFTLPENNVPEKLTRRVFKDIVLARIALQRGYSFLEEGSTAAAAELFKKAVGLNPQTVSSDVYNMLSSGNLMAAERLLEALLEREVSPSLIRLLWRVRQLSGRADDKSRPDYQALNSPVFQLGPVK